MRCTTGDGGPNAGGARVAAAGFYYSVYLLYWYKSANADTCAAGRGDDVRARPKRQSRDTKVHRVLARRDRSVHRRRLPGPGLTVCTFVVGKQVK